MFVVRICEEKILWLAGDYCVFSCSRYFFFLRGDARHATLHNARTYSHSAMISVIFHELTDEPWLSHEHEPKEKELSVHRVHMCV